MVKTARRELTRYAACAETARIDAITCGFPCRFTADFSFSRIKRKQVGKPAFMLRVWKLRVHILYFSGNRRSILIYCLIEKQRSGSFIQFYISAQIPPRNHKLTISYIFFANIRNWEYLFFRSNGVLLFHL